VEEAAKAAQIHDRIMQLPDKYNTRVGKGGIRLSGGERQRVAIARALIRNAKIIMLDEATSALDNQTDREIQAALTNLRKGRTFIVITHRLSTIVRSNLILVVEKGRIAERGTHQELVQLGGIYARMWREQVRAEEDKETRPI
jgi:ATP-binding cassette, subfamily B, vacuolar membrane transporter HMT1/ACLQ